LTKTAQGAPVYPDELGARYVWDSEVPNGGHVAPGDLAVIRDDEIVYGAGWIDSIETELRRKIRYRCPGCNRTGAKPRNRMRPKYWCANCKTAFDVRVEEELNVVESSANYSRTWRPADRHFPVKVLDTAYVKNAQQNAIRRLDLDLARPILDAYLVTGRSWWDMQSQANERIPGGHGLGTSKTRLGQQRFREAMLTRFGESCAFTGAQPPGALQAAHLYFFSETPKHDLRGGLLLRCDLHALFDRWLLTIDPATWTIQVAPELARYPDLVSRERGPFTWSAVRE
jgi:hypothetical protein